MAYAARTDVEDWFGVENVKTWADLDNDADPTKIANRIDRALAHADEEINGVLRNGLYMIPFGGTAPTLIKEIAARLAGVWLYEARGVADYDAENQRAQHRLTFHKRGGRRMLREIKVGAIQLDVTKTTMVPEVA